MHNFRYLRPNYDILLKIAYIKLLITSIIIQILIRFHIVLLHCSIYFCKPNLFTYVNNLLFISISMIYDFMVYICKLLQMHTLTKLNIANQPFFATK